MTQTCMFDLHFNVSLLPTSLPVKMEVQVSYSLQCVCYRIQSNHYYSTFNCWTGKTVSHYM